MDNFVFQNPTKIYFGKGSISHLSEDTVRRQKETLENALNVLPGTWATVDLAARNVTVLTKDEADEDAIRQAIRDAGYLPLRTTSKT